MSEYRTTDGGKLAPYAGMTDSDLADFEQWAAETDKAYSPWGVILFALAIVVIGVIL